MAIPDTMIIYLNQITPSHIIYIPPNVKTNEAKGSKSRKALSVGETLVIYNKIAKTKKTTESDRMWLWIRVKISFSDFLNRIISASSSSSLPK